MDDPDADPHSIRLIGTIHTSTAPTNTSIHSQGTLPVHHYTVPLDTNGYLKGEVLTYGQGVMYRCIELLRYHTSTPIIYTNLLQ